MNKLLVVPSEHWCNIWSAEPLPAKRLHSFLDSEEVGRASNYRFESDADQHATARALLKVAVGEALGTSWRTVKIGQHCPCGSTAHGKPVVVNNSALHLSVTHTPSTVAVAIATAPVGIDIEERCTTTVATALTRALSVLEEQVLETIPVDETDLALLHYWVRKEALLKVVGWGLTIEPSLLTMSSPVEPPELLDWRAQRPRPVPLTMTALATEVGAIAYGAFLTRDIPQVRYVKGASALQQGFQ